MGKMQPDSPGWEEGQGQGRAGRWGMNISIIVHSGGPSLGRHYYGTVLLVGHVYFFPFLHGHGGCDLRRFFKPRLGVLEAVEQCFSCF